MFAYYDLKDRYTALERQVEDLDAESRALSQEIRLLKSDREHIEKEIREQMNYLKDNEILYVFPEEAPEGAPGAGLDEE